MAHLSGLFLIDCPASALNNFGNSEDIGMTRPSGSDRNWSATKYFRTNQNQYVPFVSAQAFRYWLRETLTNVPGWKSAPMFREKKIAYTDANPIDYADDDVFGYMRAPGVGNQKGEWEAAGLIDQSRTGKKSADGYVALTRSSPFKVSTLISVAPLRELGFDYGTMSRGEGDPVPHVHEFYRTTLVGLFSIDLRMLGRFYHVDRTGYRHLDEVRKELAQARGLKAYDNGKAYELDLETRKARLKQLLEGLSRISGGAKQALHYTDVAPKFLFLAVAKGGNHLFGTAIGANKDGTPKINDHALKETATVFQDELLSKFYAGLAQGYLDDQRGALEGMEELEKIGQVSRVGHPVEAIRKLISDLDANDETWLA